MFSNKINKFFSDSNCNTHKLRNILNIKINLLPFCTIQKITLTENLIYFNIKKMYRLYHNI